MGAAYRQRIVKHTQDTGCDCCLALQINQKILSHPDNFLGGTGNGLSPMPHGGRVWANNAPPAPPCPRAARGHTCTGGRAGAVQWACSAVRWARGTGLCTGKSDGAHGQTLPRQRGLRPASHSLTGLQCIHQKWTTDKESEYLRRCPSQTGGQFG